MKKLTIALSLAAVALSLAAVDPVHGHHSVASGYDLYNIFTKTGVLTRVDWVMPHSWVFFDVKTDDGKVENWSIEFPTAFRRQGGSRDYFVVGQTYKIMAAPAKSGEHKGYITELTLPDGRKISMLGQI
jgi:hypothetical protein